VHEIELGIVFADQAQAPSSVPHPMSDDEQDWEEDEMELLGDRAMLVSSIYAINAITTRSATSFILYFCLQQ
jgi:hypothetical protein